MSELIIIGYDDHATAGKAYEKVQSLRSTHIVELAGLAVVTVDSDGKSHVDTPGKQVTDSALSGALFGMIFGVLFVVPFAGMIVGWDVTATANAAMVERALADGLGFRRRQGHPIQPGAVRHSDAGSTNTPPWHSASSWSSPRSGPRSAQSVTPTTTL